MHPEPAPGAVVAGKYKVEERIAVGGMATILRAKHLGLGEPVALKILLPRYRNSEEFVRRFQCEARAAARLKSEHVARVLDFGSLGDGTPYLAMELLDGQDLEARLLERGPMSIGEAVDHLLQACEALAEAHALGIVHRDLKPQNLFLTRAPDGSSVLKVIDFGIAKTVGGRAGLTAKHTSMGTPHYMSPEQIRATEGVDARSDIWALGVILHELLTGKNMYSATTIDELLVAVATTDPTLALEPRHAALEPVLRKCLTRDREARFSSVYELAEALLPFGDVSAIDRVARLRRVEEAARARTQTRSDDDVWPAPISVRPMASSVPTMAATQPASLPRHRSRWMVVAAAAAIVGSLGLGASMRMPRGAQVRVAAATAANVAAVDRAEQTATPMSAPRLAEPPPATPPPVMVPAPSTTAAPTAVKAPAPRRVRNPVERDRHFNTRK